MSAPAIISSGTAAGGPPVGGSGTTNTIPRWTGPSTLGDSGLIDNGTAIYTTTRDVGFGIASPNAARFQSVGVDDKWSARLHGSTTVGKSYGALIEAGTNSGDIALRVRAAGAGSDYLYVRGDGNVGIGTASPAGKLDIADAASASVYISRPGLSAVYGAAGLGNLRWRDTANAFDAAQISAVGYFPGSNGQMAFSTASAGVQTERMRITDTGNVGIGTASPGGRLDVVGAAGLSWAIRAQVSSANTSPALNAELGLNLKNTSTTVGNYTSITNRDSSDNANTQINFINVNNSGSGAINFVTRDSVGGSGERARIDSSGNLILNSANTGATIQAAGTSQGLKLQGTAGTNNTDPNVLDFYADGGTANSGGVTWTPELRFGGATTGITYTTQVGRYTRVGNMIFATCYIALSSKGSATGAATIAGLPTSSNTSGLFSSGSIGYNVGVTYTNMLLVRMNANASAATLTNSSAAGALANVTDANFTNTSELVFSIAYPVT